MTDSLRRALHFCSSSATAFGELLHFAAAFRRPSASSCILQRHFDGLRRAPAFCSSISTAFGELLHFAAAFRRPSMSSCIFATAFRRPSMSSCIFATTGEELQRAPTNIRWFLKEQAILLSSYTKSKDAISLSYRNMIEHLCSFIAPYSDVPEGKSNTGLNVLVLTNGSELYGALG